MDTIVNIKLRLQVFCPLFSQWFFSLDDFSTLIIGDSHVRRLKHYFQFTDCTLVSVSGLTSDKLLTEHCYKMLVFDRGLICCGGNDVCDNPTSGRKASPVSVVKNNLAGL